MVAKIMACNERIVNSINDAVKFELKRQMSWSEEFEDPDMIDPSLLEASELCDKIMNTNYFEESEEYLNRIIKNKVFREFNRLKWMWIYYKNRRHKTRDLRELFKLIEKHSEDWC